MYNKQFTFAAAFELRCRWKNPCNKLRSRRSLAFNHNQISWKSLKQFPQKRVFFRYQKRKTKPKDSTNHHTQKGRVVAHERNHTKCEMRNLKILEMKMFHKHYKISQCSKKCVCVKNLFIQKGKKNYRQTNRYMYLFGNWKFSNKN